MQIKKWMLITIIICLTSQISFGQYQEFMYEGIMRQYAVIEPSLEPDPDGYPLIIGLHGAAMAYRIAAELSPKIAAMGVSSGQMLFEYCNPEFPVPIIHFHGLSDDKFPYYGSSDSAQTVPPVDTTMAIWRGINNCSAIPDTIYNDNEIIGKKWTSSTGLSDIVLYTNSEGEHEWPRPANWGISATDEIWDYFELHTRNIETNVEDNDTQSIPKNIELFQNYPNPFNPKTIIPFSVQKPSRVVPKIYDLLGRETATLVDNDYAPGEYNVLFNGEGFASGIYFYRIQMGDFSQTRKMVLLD